MATRPAVSSAASVTPANVEFDDVRTSSGDVDPGSIRKTPSLFDEIFAIYSSFKGLFGF